METGGGEGDQVNLLRQARDRAGRVAEDLSRHRLDLETPCRTVPAPALAEGEAVVRKAADAAAALRECLEDLLRPQGSPSPSTPTDQGRT